MNLSKGNKDEKMAAIIAACITFGAALVVLVLLFVLTVGSDRRALAETSIPELQDDEDIYLEPDLLVVDNAGDENVENIDAPAPQTLGEPDPVNEDPDENKVRVVKNEKEPEQPPVSNKPEKINSKENSDAKTSTPKLTKEEEQRIASLQGKFKSDNNGSRTGTETANSGSGGDGVSLQGKVSGRKMLSCPTWKLILSQKTTVKVNITVDAAGNVTKATAVSGAGTPNLRKQCEEMAKRSKWTPQEGAAPTSGTITFTITPK